MCVTVERRFFVFKVESKSVLPSLKKSGENFGIYAKSYFGLYIVNIQDRRPAQEIGRN